MEEMIEKVYELLKDNAENVSVNHWINAIHEDKFQNLAESIVKLCNMPVVMRCACCGNTTKFSDGAKQQILIDEEYRYIYAVTCDECGKVCDVELFD